MASPPKKKKKKGNKIEEEKEAGGKGTITIAGECVHKQYAVERAIQTEIDTRTEKKGVGKLGWFMAKNINRNIPTK